MDKPKINSGLILVYLRGHSVSATTLMHSFTQLDFENRHALQHLTA